MEVVGINRGGEYGVGEKWWSKIWIIVYLRGGVWLDLFWMWVVRLSEGV